MEVSGQLQNPGRLSRGENTHGSHSAGGWLGPRYGLDTLWKIDISCLYEESNHGSSVVLPIVQSLYLLHMPAPCICFVILKQKMLNFEIIVRLSLEVEL